MITEPGDDAFTWVATESSLRASADDVWQWVTTPAGVNDELRPAVRMTVPSGWQGTSIADVEPGSHPGP